MDIRPDGFDQSPDEPQKISFGKLARFRGRLLKIGFYALLGLMSCGTLLIVLYAFVGRGFIG